MSRVINYLYSVYCNFFSTDHLMSSIFSSLDEAVVEIEKRRKDPDLISRVEKYLNGDIPEHFNKQFPIFYLSRFLATPNFETLHVSDLVKDYPYTLVVGQDIKSKFSTNNETKICLAKLSVVKGYDKSGKEIIENVTVIDFSKFQGRSFTSIDTKFEKSLIYLHKLLFSLQEFQNVVVADEDEWVDRNFRNDLYKQYKKMWALLCVHGIMFESYPPTEHDFFRKLVYPTFKEVERELGIKPLVVEHISSAQESERDWNAYPSKFYDTIKQFIANKK